MATAAVSRQCSKCEKNVGVFNCEGCKGSFCTKHAVEHQQELSIKFEHLMTEHNLILQQVYDNEQQNESSRKDILCQIDQWEKNMIEKVREKAEEVRQLLVYLMDNENKLITDNFQDVKNELRKRYETEDYFEQDLERIKQNIDQIRQETDKLIQRSKIELHVKGSSEVNWSRLIYFNEAFVKTPSSVVIEKANHSGDKQSETTVNASSQLTTAQHNDSVFQSPDLSSAYGSGPRGMNSGYLNSGQRLPQPQLPPYCQNPSSNFVPYSDYAELYLQTSSRVNMNSPRAQLSSVTSETPRIPLQPSYSSSNMLSSSQPEKRQKKPLRIVDPVSHDSVWTEASNPPSTANRILPQAASTNDTTSSSLSQLALADEI